MFAAGMSWMGVSPVWAASFEVTNLDDAGAGSLRDAIATANSTPGADVITFAAGLTGSITLTSGELAISDSVNIVGPGRNALTINANAASRALDIYAPAAPPIDVTISGLTVTNGSANNGGGIYLQDENLTLDDVAITNSQAVGAGGGLWADGFDMTLTVTNSTISGNTSGDDGGGVYVEDTGGVLTFDTVVIDGNTAANNGGGIYFYDPDHDVVIVNSTITGNAAGPTGRGGGIYLYNLDGVSAITIADTTISGNTAYLGGGVFLYNTDYLSGITGSTISGNSATAGGGVFILSADQPFGITDSTISGNTASDTGGGIYVDGGPYLYISNTTITANTAQYDGGAHFGGDVDMSHTIVAGNTAPTAPGIHTLADVSLDFSLVDAIDGGVLDNGGNQIGAIDPLLGPLADNGGPTKTHMLLVGSPALDTGDPAFGATPSLDQRGLPRIDGVIDIGAVEAQRGVIQFELAGATVAEAAGTVVIPVVRSGGADLPAAIDVATADGTATAPADYTATAATLSWAAGEIGTKSITVPLVFDALHEPDETFSASLSNPVGAAIGASPNFAVTLQNSNTAPTIAPIADVSGTAGVAVPAIGVTIGDAEQTLDSLTLTASSSNPAVVADAGIAISGSGASRTLAISPLAAGSAVITVTVSDGALTTTSTFTVVASAATPTPDPFGDLPATGKETGRIAGLAAILLALGTAMSGIGRRRRA